MADNAARPDTLVTVPNVLGKVCIMNEGDLSVPIKGENGVFIVRVDGVSDALPNKDYSEMKQQLSQNRSSRVNFAVFDALKSRVEIIDNRYKVY